MKKKWRKRTSAKTRNAGRYAKEKKDTGRIILDFAGRYLFLILAAMKDLWIFYFIFTPLTLYPTGFLLSLFFEVNIYQQAISVNGFLISMVRACIAGSAYYFLLILNLITRGISLVKRVKMFLFSAFLLLVLNIARIILLAAMQVNNAAYFDATHKIFWYGISTIYVVLVWLLAVKIFKIKGIPFYSDFMFLRSQITKKKRR